MSVNRIPQKPVEADNSGRAAAAIWADSSTDGVEDAALSADLSSTTLAVHGDPHVDDRDGLRLAFQRITGDWNGDGQDTLGIMGDFDADGDVDGTDFL